MKIILIILFIVLNKNSFGALFIGKVLSQDNKPLNAVIYLKNQLWNQYAHKHRRRF